MLISWLLFPLVLLVLALGCGLLLERASGARLPGVLVIPAGLAVMVVVGLFPLMSEPTAPLTMPLLVLLAIAGLVLGAPWRRGPLDGWAVVCGVAVFAVYAAPIVLSGDATLAGYLGQIDVSTYLGVTDHVMEHGRDLDGLGYSNYQTILSHVLPQGYPLGGFVPLGTGQKLVGQDVAWLFQPYLAFFALMLALTLYALVARLVPSRPVRALLVFVASQPAILFGFSLWAGIKELSGAWIVALACALLVPALRAAARGRALLPLAVAAAATIGLLSFASGLWLVPVMAAALAVAFRLHGRDTVLAQAGAFLAFAALISIPSLVAAGGFFDDATGEIITGDTLGLLFGSLSWRQVFGIWPTGDFRGIPDAIEVTTVLVLVVLAAAGAGLVWAWRRRAWELALYVSGVPLACLIISLLGSPWVDSKAFAIASPAVVVAALVGALAIPPRFRRLGTPLVVAAIAGGVLWSNVVAYHDVSLAPRAELRELQQLGDRFDGQGPTLLTQYEPYGYNHFLRETDPQGPANYGTVIPVRGGFAQTTPRRGTVDSDSYDVQKFLAYRTLIRRRSPFSSRPPSAYRLVWTGRYYEVWQRPEEPRPVIDHVPLATGVQPAGKPRCRFVELIADAAGRGGRIATVERLPVTVVDLPGTPVWAAEPVEGALPYLLQSEETRGAAPPSDLRSGAIKGNFEVPVTGRYRIWTSGSFRRRIELVVDGEPVASPRTELVFSEDYFLLIGSRQLRAGSHSFEFRYDDEGALHPGTGGYATIAPGSAEFTKYPPLLDFGPLVLSREGDESPVEYVRPSQARSLCTKNLDWIEAVPAAGLPAGQ